MAQISGKILSRWELTQKNIEAVLEEKLGKKVVVGDDGFVYNEDMSEVLGEIGWKMTGENSGTWFFAPEG